MIMRSALLEMKSKSSYFVNMKINSICDKYIPNVQFEILSIKFLNRDSLISFNAMNVAAAANGNVQI